MMEWRVVLRTEEDLVKSRDVVTLQGCDRVKINGYLGGSGNSLNHSYWVNWIVVAKGAFQVQLRGGGCRCDSSLAYERLVSL